MLKKNSVLGKRKLVIWSYFTYYGFYFISILTPSILLGTLF
jgi:hypothetical protein